MRGQLFFASAEAFLLAFDFREPLHAVRIDVSHAHLWDLTSVHALQRAVRKFEDAGITVTVDGLNQASRTLIGRLGTSAAGGTH